jgi:hypothetical protein
MTLHIYNVDGYVLDTVINAKLHVDLSNVRHEKDGSVTLITDQLWMTHVGKLARKPLSAFEGAVDPRNWDDCSATKSFFVAMREVPPPTPPASWPKVIDETVRLHPFSPHPDVTARLSFTYEATAAVVECKYKLDPNNRREIVVDKGGVTATKISHKVTDRLGNSGQATFFRFTSHKRIKFAKQHLPPDPITAMVWGWAAIRLVDCAG